jgi:hypothetical protein
MRTTHKVDSVQHLVSAHEDIEREVRLGESGHVWVLHNVVSDL